jgi:DNA-binding beta-propeller fold protein YncE
VFQYFVDSSGTFNAIPAGASPYTVGSNPTGLAFSRCAGVSSQTSHCAAADGNNLFVSNTGSDSLTVFTACIQVLGACTVADGSLLPVSGTAPATGIGPIQVIVDPVIDFVYTVDRSTGSGQVSQFSYSPLTSALTALTPPAVSTGSAPAGGGISSDGSTLLVANNGGSNLFVFRVSQPSSSGSSSGTGRLIPANPESVSVSGQPSAVLVR